MSSWAYACGADETDTSPNDELPYTTPSSDDAGAADASKLDAGSKPVTHRDGSVPVSTDDPLNADSACAASSLSAEQVVVEQQVQVPVTTTSPAPVALYVMLDKSLSMSTSNLWNPAVAALTSFVRDTKSSGMDIAMQYFPGGGQCNGGGYDTPAVPMARLPDNANAIVAGMGKQSPTGFGTPIEGALRGVTTYCKNFQAAHPDENCIAVLVTDGKPELDGCVDDSTKLAAIAGDAWTKDKVRTFAVGLQGADFGLLDAIAKSGGASDCDTTTARFACDVSGGTDKLSIALGKIRDTVTTTVTHTETHTVTETHPLECTWKMPTPSADMTIDKDRINVTLSGGSDVPLSLGRVPDASTCTLGAWYFDVPSAPTQIVACPATCDALKTAGYTDVNILLGCETHVILL